MLSQFQQHINTKFQQFETQQIGVAISGGVDSVVLANLCAKLGLNISLLHCNFQLRGDASDGDQAFVKRLASSLKVPFITTEFNTNAYIEINKVSTQVGARELRYNWFEKMAKLYHLDVIVTAHHSDDNLETFLINLSRGTGLEGLTGIPEINGLYIRPLLPFSKKEILVYAKQNKLQWREDASNSDTKYVRNKLRHNVIPLLKEMQPNMLSNFKTTISYLQKSQEIVKSYTQSFKDSFFEKAPEINGFKINIEALKKESNSELILFEILKEFNFKAWSDITALQEGQSGKKILSHTHVLLKDRDFLLLYPFKEKSTQEIAISEKETTVKLSRFEELHFNSAPSPSEEKYTLQIDKDKVNFPLTVRKMREGDYFYPSGMQGKKKVSKYFKDEKFSIPQKENTWLLCNKEEVIWIVGYRANRHFLVSQDTKNKLTITYKNEYHK